MSTDPLPATQTPLAEDPLAESRSLPGSGGALLVRSLRRQWRRSAIGAGFLALWQASEALVPVAIGLVIDHALLPRDPRALLLGLLGMTLLFVVLSYSYRFGSRSLNAASAQEGHALRVEVASHALFRTDSRDLVPGEVMSRSTADADGATRIFSQLGMGTSAAAGFLGAAAYLLITDPVVGLVVLVVAPLISVIVTRSGKGISDRSADQQAAMAEAGARVGDIISGFRVLTALGGQDWANRSYHDASRSSAQAAVRTASATGKVSGIGELAVSLTLGTVLLIAGWRVISGDLGAGQLVAIVGVGVYLSEPIRLLGNTIAAGATAHGAARRIVEFLWQQDAPRDHGDTIAAGSVRLPGPGPTIPAGTFCAIDPGGAADRARLLSALHGHDAGVEIDNRPVTDYAAGLAGGLLIAPHTADVFEGTLRSNITMSHQPGVVVDPGVLRASAAQDMTYANTEGPDHPTREAGSNLSGGERQRLVLARALHADPPVLVLDDPTSAVDSVTELEIARGIHAHRCGRTTLVLTSSPVFHRVADISVDPGGRK